MCTVTVVHCPVSGAVRLACNRDEQRSRVVAVPPRARRFGRHRALLPLDPHSGGTWVAVNDAGLALALLNVSAAPPTAVPPRSRGSIIPELLSCDTLAEALGQAASLDAANFAPFRLVLVDRHELAELRSDGTRGWVVGRRALREPRLFTSSGLGDHLVEGPRRQLFDERFQDTDAPAARQDEFHRHHWPDRPHLSVCMRRPDARTVSHTVVALGADGVALTYRAGAPDEPAEAFRMQLSLKRGGA